MISTILIMVALLFFLPSEAYAWGPSTHLELAGKVLEHLTLFAPVVKKLLSQYRDHFLYGSIAADITIAKNAKGSLYNCHNWSIALDLFHNKAKKDPQKAFMLGYLGHLAADTVAHNFFIPYKLIRSWKTKLLKHLYWEMRMDFSVPEKYVKLIDDLADHDYKSDDELLEGHLKRTVFSFKTNKKIFNSLIILQRMKQYRKIALTMADKSVWILSPKDIRDYKNLALESEIDFLTNQEKSFCMHADPTGELKMLYAKETIKKIRQAKKEGQLDYDRETRLLLDMKHQLKEGLYQPVTLPVVESYF